jgi:DNA-binding GntR family transcriptional regulator
MRISDDLVPTKTETAYDALKRGIIRGDIAEGGFLSEPEMMKRYGIGRTPYREACNRLHHEGLLEVVPRRGFFVPKSSFQAVRDLFEARLITEGVIAALAARRASDAEIDELEKIVHRRPGSRPEQVIKANIEFHRLLAKMARNGELERILVQLLDRTQRLMFMELGYGNAGSSFKADHLPICAALRKRDAAAARRAVQRDIGLGQSVLVGGLPLDGAQEDVGVDGLDEV